MATNLPQPITAYFQAANAFDTNSLLTHFTADAEVTDEGKDYHGLDAIRVWSNKVNDKYQATLVILDSAQVGDETVCNVLVSGTFDGSPIQVPWRFTLKGDKIAVMKIGE